MATAEAITPAQQMMSSCIGAILTSFIMTPLDVVKIRLQAQAKPFKTGSCFIYNNGLMDCLYVCTQCRNGDSNTTKPSPSSPQRPWYDRPGQFKGTLDAFVKITRAEGITALWSGLPPTLLMSVPATVIYFTTYDRLKYAFGYNEFDPSTKYLPIPVGMTARAVIVTIFNPLEMLRTKLQSEQLSYLQLRKAIQISVKQEGWSFMMKGYGPTLLRDIPFSALYWFSYEFTKSYQMRHNQTKKPNFFLTFFSGASAGLLAAFLTQPFDVIKTHRQLELGKEIKDRKKLTWKVLFELYGKQGLTPLYAGIVPRMLRIVPSTAIMITTYEFFKVFFQERNRKT